MSALIHSVDLANELLDTFTARQMGKVFFTNSGSEANDSQWSKLKSSISSHHGHRKERNITEHVKSISPRFQDGIKAFSDNPIIEEIRGNGLVFGTEFTDNKSPSDLFPVEWATPIEMEFFFRDASEELPRAELNFYNQDIQRCPFFRNINIPTNFSLLSPMNFPMPAKLQRRCQELTQTTPDQPVDDEAMYYKVAGFSPTTRHRAVAPRRSPRSSRSRATAGPHLCRSRAAAGVALLTNLTTPRRWSSSSSPSSRHFLVAGTAVRDLHVALCQHPAIGLLLLLLIPRSATVVETSSSLLPRVRGLAGATLLVRSF
ncbi:hypothetical protein Syun_027772 [Stephania yunnanensis]|uniref:Uncharacterized protein n=1 Tax=Stephania yunnanensis TaxID=152371 RepID=A0AAP0EG82_9MAGN